MRIRFTSIKISYIAQAKRPVLFFLHWRHFCHYYYFDLLLTLEFMDHIARLACDQNQRL
jgi:hypothetical protein